MAILKQDALGRLPEAFQQSFRHDQSAAFRASAPPFFLLLNRLVAVAYRVGANHLVDVLCRFKMRRVRAFHSAGPAR